MAILDETCGLVLLVAFTTGSVHWSVRVKRVVADGKHRFTIVNATSKRNGKVITARAWDALLGRTGQAEEFWTTVAHAFLLHAGGVPIAKA